MKKFLLATLLLSFFSVVALSAAETDTTKAAVDKYPSFKGFMTNKFWDNWELSASVGTGFAIYSGGNYGTFGQKFGFSGEISAAKWFHPVVAVRVGLMGGQYGTVHPDLGKVNWPYIFTHVDAMVNLSNWIGGYREDRVYYAVPFAGMGLFASNFTDKAQAATQTGNRLLDFAFTAGIINKFRVSPSVDINLELKGILGRAKMNPVVSPSRGAFLGTANISVGVTYRFGKRDFVRGAAGYSLEDIDALKQAVKEAKQNAKDTEEKMNAKLADCQAKQAVAQKRADDAEKRMAEQKAQYEREASIPSQTVFFDYGMAVLSKSDKIRLEVFKDQVLAGPKDHVYTVTGYADFKTGKDKYNVKLAEKRARVVYNYLVKLGVPESQLTYTGTDAAEQPNIGEGNQFVTVK